LFAIKYDVIRSSSDAREIELSSLSVAIAIRWKIRATAFGDVPTRPPGMERSTSSGRESKGNDAPLGYIFFRISFRCHLTMRGTLQNPAEYFLFVGRNRERRVHSQRRSSMHYLRKSFQQRHGRGGSRYKCLAQGLCFPHCRLTLQKRKMLRSTAKDTIVYGNGFTSWLIRQSIAP